MPKASQPKTGSRVLEDSVVYSTPWVNLVERRVETETGPQPFYALSQQDYVSIVAVTPTKRILTVRQYRAAVDALTLELPAGTVDGGETPEESCRRELTEETGHRAVRVESLGSFFPDTGRSMNLQHAFLAEVEEHPSSAITEAGISLEYYSLEDLRKKILEKQFRHQLHISVLLLAVFLKSEWKWK